MLLWLLVNICAPKLLYDIVRARYLRIVYIADKGKRERGDKGPICKLKEEINNFGYSLVFVQGVGF